MQKKRPQYGYSQNDLIFLPFKQNRGVNWKESRDATKFLHFVQNEVDHDLGFFFFFCFVFFFK